METKTCQVKIVTLAPPFGEATELEVQFKVNEITSRNLYEILSVRRVDSGKRVRVLSLLRHVTNDDLDECIGTVLHGSYAAWLKVANKGTKPLKKYARRSIKVSEDHPSLRFDGYFKAERKARIAKAKAQKDQEAQRHRDS